MHGEKARHSKHKLKVFHLHTDVRRKMSPGTKWGSGIGCPRRLCSHHPWSFSRLDQGNPQAHNLSSWLGLVEEEGWIRVLLRSLLIWIILPSERKFPGRSSNTAAAIIMVKQTATSCLQKKVFQDQEHFRIIFFLNPFLWSVQTF